MAKTYTLNSTQMHCGYRSSVSGYWSGFIGSDANGMHIGMYRNFYRMVNIMFDQATLASLRTKTVTSIKLKITFASAATIYDSTDTKWPIGYKLNNVGTTEGSGDAWTRSDADSTAQATTVLGYIRSSGSQYTVSANESIVLDLTGTKVPVYGYVLGTYQGSGYDYVLTSSATLTVVTNETDYTLKLSYNANGGSGSVAQQSATVTTSGTPSYTFTVNPSGTAVSKTGNTFLGWSTNSSATSASYTNGSSITISSNTTLYAVYQPYKVTIRYNANGGSMASTHGTGYAVNSSGYVTYNGSTDFHIVNYGSSSDPYDYNYSGGVNLVRTGYACASGAEWNTAANGSGTSFNQSTSYAATTYASNVSTGNRTIILYANWKATTSYISANNGTLGTQMTIGIVRYNSSYTHTVTYKYGSATGTIGTGIGTSVNWTPPISMASQFPSSTSGTCTLYCQTYSGSTLLGTTSTNITLSIPTTVKCTVSSVSLAETVSSVASKFGAYVQGKSKIRVTGSTSTSNAYGATVTAYSISINGQTLTSNGATTGLIGSYGTLSYSFKITDTRGRTDTFSGTYNVLAYTAPNISATVQRDSSAPTSININYSWSVSAVNNLNDKTLSIKYRPFGGGAWTTATTITPSTYSGSSSYTITGTDTDTAYETSLQLTDYFTTVSSTSSVSALGTRIFGIAHIDQTIARHGDSPADGYDHQYFNERFHGVVDVVNRRCYANLSSAGWYRVLIYNASNVAKARGYDGQCIDFTITRQSVNAYGEIHKITYLAYLDSFSFVNESSKSGAFGIDKIRYTRDSANGYIDIHFNLNALEGVQVDIDVHTRQIEKLLYQSANLIAVSDAPSGETILSTYSFKQHNTALYGCNESNLLASGTVTNSNSFTYTATQPCWMYLSVTIQAGSSGGYNLSLNSVTLSEYSSNEALSVYNTFIPVPLQTGDVLIFQQWSNRTSTYKVFAMR